MFYKLYEYCYRTKIRVTVYTLRFLKQMYLAFLKFNNRCIMYRANNTYCYTISTKSKSSEEKFNNNIVRRLNELYGTVRNAHFLGGDLGAW